MVKGIIALEPLTDKTYVRLLVPEIVIDVDRTSPKRKRKRSAPPRKPEPDDSIMYR
jgi:hypothetical protein